MVSFDGQMEKTLYRMIGCFNLSCIVAFCMGDAMRISQTEFRFSFVILVPVGLISLYAFLLGRYRKVMLILTPILLFDCCLVIGWQNMSVFANAYIQWLKGSRVDSELLPFVFQMLQILWIVILSYLTQFLLERFFALKVCLGVLCLGILAYSMFRGITIPYSGVVYVFVFISVLLIQGTQLSWKKTKKQSNVRYMLEMMIFVFIFFIAMIFMPISEQPYQWKYVKASVAYCKEKLVELINDLLQEEDVFTFSLAGFSEEGKIKGSVEESGREIMTVTADREMQSNLYLSGKCFNVFENQEWRAEQNEEHGNRYADTLQTMYALRSSEAEDIKEHYKKVHLKIAYKDLNTRYLFVPEKTYAVYNGQEQKLAFTAEDGSLFFDKSQNYGSSYYVDFYQMDLVSGAMNDLLGSPVKDEETLYEDVLKGHGNTTGLYLKEDDLEAYEKNCYQEYAIPVVLSQKVQDYIDTVTDGEVDRVARLRAIERELCSYSYSLHVEKLPASVKDATGYLDYFLLESQEGYCSHFATAFVLLARAEGFPARYVQGYCVPMHGKKEAVVWSDMAHAWPEVYFKDIGWIAFEPTPGYSELRYTTWSEGGGSSVGSDYYTKLYQREEWEAEDGLQGESEDFTEVSNRVVSTMAKILVILIAFGFLILAAVFILRKVRYCNWTWEEKYLLEIKKNFELMSVFGAELSETETVTEYADRIKAQESGLELGDFFEDYEQVIYGNRGVDEKLFKTVEKQHEKMLLCLKEKSVLGYIKYCVVRFVKYGV